MKERKIFLDSVHISHMPLTKRDKFYLNRKWSFVPTYPSLNFTRKILVVGNEGTYSSVASAMLLPNARNDNQIHSVGRSASKFLGAGYSPVILSLPYSGIRYRIELAIAVTGTITPADLMHDRSELSSLIRWKKS